MPSHQSREEVVMDRVWLKPSALVPVAMSVTALAIVVGYAAIFGIARQAHGSCSWQDRHRL